MTSAPYTRFPIHGTLRLVRDMLLGGLNPMSNAQVCVYLTVHITKLQPQTTFPKPLYIPHSACIHKDIGR
jgi:hypothetical protein